MIQALNAQDVGRTGSCNTSVLIQCITNANKSQLKTPHIYPIMYRYAYISCMVWCCTRLHRGAQGRTEEGMSMVYLTPPISLVLHSLPRWGCERGTGGGDKEWLYLPILIPFSAQNRVPPIVSVDFFVVL